MNNLIAARSQMGMSLAFHIIFATISVALPLMMTVSEWLGRRIGNPVYLLLAKRWAKGTAILLAVGADSGTVLSFELGLLWPRFTQFAAVLSGSFKQSFGIHPRYILWLSRTHLINALAGSKTS